MLVSPNPPAQTVPIPASSELDPDDPLWRHVKTEWDHQFVKRANFLPWLRAQLQIDPIDEASSAPEPLLCYVKRRFALAQNQQRLRGSANQSTSGPTDQPANAAVVQAPLNAASNAVGTSVETQASSLGAPDSCTGDTSRPGPSGSPKSEGPPATYPASEVHDQVTSDASGAPSNGIISQADVSSSSTYLTSKPTPSSSNVFSSQLGAIADAHMGHSSHMTSASLSSTLSSQPGGFHSDSNGIHGSRAYPQADESHPSDSPQQPQLSSSLPSSSYVNHPTHSNLALAHTATHPHRLQHPSVSQYTQAPQFMKITPHTQFPDTHKSSSEHHADGLAHGHQSFGFNKSAPVSQSGSCSSVPLLQIDPALMAGYETSYVLASQTSNQSVPVVSPAANVAPVVIAARSIDVTSPRRTRSAAALTNENQPAAIVPCSSDTEKLPPTKKRGPRSASSSLEDTSVETVPNLPAHSPTDPKEISHKEGSNASNHLPSSPPVDQYNRKAWKSRLASVRSELDQIFKAPSRSASKLVKILSMYSISPTPTSGDWSTVPPEGRVEVLSAMKAGLPQDFYNTWVSESKGLAMLESWLKGSVHIQEKAKSKGTSGESAQNGDVSQRETLLINILQVRAMFIFAHSICIAFPPALLSHATIHFHSLHAPAP